MRFVVRWIPATLFVVLPGFKSGQFLFGADRIGGTYHLLQAVRVPAGRHDILFRHRSRFLGLVCRRRRT